MQSEGTLGDARSLERALTALRGIRKARVDEGPGGEISIEIFAIPERSEAATRKQVESVATAMLGPGSSIKQVTVLVAAKRSLPGGQERRRKLSSLVTRRTHENFSTQVILSIEGDVLTGEAECATPRHQAASVAQAVVDGLAEIAREPLEVEAVETIRMGDETLVVVSLMFGERVLLGSAEVRFDLPDAIARATLHALNRSISYAG